MITTTREFDTYEQAQEGFAKAFDAFYYGYGFYPHSRGDCEPGGDIYIRFNYATGKWTFTYSRGDSCD